MTRAITQIAWSDRTGYNQAHVIVPDSTEVKAVAKAGTQLLAEHAVHVANSRALEAARKTVEQMANSARAEAMEAGRVGEKLDKPKIKKRKAAAADALEDAELDFDHSSEALRVAASDYLAVLAHHTPALAAEARQAADHAILSFVTAVKLARGGAAEFDAATGILAALSGARGGDFKPVAPKARAQAGDDFGEAPLPGLFASTAVDNLSKAVGYGTRVLEDLAVDAKRHADEAKLEAAEAAEDEADDVTIEGEDDDEDD